MKSRNVYTVFFDEDNADFRKRVKRLVLAISHERGEQIKQSDVLDIAVAELEKKYP